MMLLTLAFHHLPCMICLSNLKFYLKYLVSQLILNNSIPKTMISFICYTKDFKEALKLLRAPNKRKKIESYKSTCEITLTDNYVQLAIPGAVVGFKAKTKGTAKATISFRNLWSIIDCHNLEQLLVEFYDESMRFGIVQVKANTIFFKDDSILRTIRLSNNYTDVELLLLKNQGYTSEELKFNNLLENIDEAEKRVYANIRKAALVLKDYGVSPSDIKSLLMERLGLQLNLDEKDISQLLSKNTSEF
jgi:hypothetical protein